MISLLFCKSTLKVPRSRLLMPNMHPSRLSFSTRSNSPTVCTYTAAVSACLNISSLNSKVCCSHSVTCILPMTQRCSLTMRVRVARSYIRPRLEKWERGELTQARVHCPELPVQNRQKKKQAFKLHFRDAHGSLKLPFQQRL